MALGFNDHWLASKLGQAEMAIRRRDFPSLQSAINTTALEGRTNVLPYFRTRFLDLDCRRFFGSGDFTSYLPCQAKVIASYRQIGEVYDEINSSINFIQGLQPFLQLSALEKIRSRLELIKEVPGIYLYRGRFFLLASRIYLNTGLLANSLQANRQAIEDFKRATEESAGWLVSSYSQLATLQARLGLYDQSTNTFLFAFKSLNLQDSPARAASLIQQFSIALYDSGDEAKAKTLLLKAVEIRRLIGVKLDYAIAKLVEFELGPPSDLSELAILEYASPALKNRVDLVFAEVLVRTNQLDSAKRIVESLQKRNLSDFEKDSLASVEFELMRVQSIKSAAFVLIKRINALAQTADQSPTAALAYLTLRSGEKVRRAWVDALTPSNEPASVFRTALLATPARFMTSVTTVQKRVETVAKQAAGEVGFLAQLTGPQAVAPERFKAVNVPELAAFQARLQKGGLALLLLPGDKQSAALWVSQDRAWVGLLPARAELMAQVLSLSRALASPQSAPKTAQDAARVLASTLFAGMQNQAAPSSLWIVADELSAAIPFSTLQWPGSAEPLVAGTDISLITGLRVDPAQPGQPSPAARPALSAFFAPAYSNAGAAANPAGLQNLEFAAIERARIERESGKNWQAVIGKDATRAAFQDLIQTPGLMLHVAAHGRADPGVLGNAGLWLANDAGPDADFLSWLELGNMRTQAELLVLNACQSATGAQPSRQANISFALAMSASGANHVVAALWPVSDVASGTWIPAFYKQLTIGQAAGDLGGAHSAAALRQAQLSLHQSPHYRHPFYWASLVHFRRVVF